MTMPALEEKQAHKIEIETRYISPRLMWDHKANIQEGYAAKSPALRAIQQATRLNFVSRVENNEFIFMCRPCVVCGGTRFIKLSDLDRMGLYFPMSMCRVCGLVQANPVLRQSDYQDFYSTLYRNLFGARRKVVESTLRAKANNRGARFYAYLEKMKVLELISKKNDLIVEVGCGDGALVSYFHDRGYRVIGIDFDDDYMDLGRRLGYDLRTATLAEVAAEQKPKLVYYHHVLEHIAEINEHLNSLSQLIQESGVVAIVVPGIKNIHKSYRGDLLRYLQIAHVFNFSLYTLEMLMTRFGFKLLAGNECIQALFKKEEAQARVTAARSESFAVIHYLKGLEAEMRKTERKAAAGE